MAAAQGCQPPSGGDAKARPAAPPVGPRARSVCSVNYSVLKRLRKPNHTDYAMQNDHNNARHDNLAEIWSRAQHRRAEDIYSWLTQILERTRRRESNAPAAVQRMKTASATKGAG